jgi:hypothetical protein
LRYEAKKSEHGKWIAQDILLGGAHEFDTFEEAKKQVDDLNRNYEQTAKEYERKNRVLEPYED